MPRPSDLINLRLFKARGLTCSGTTFRVTGTTRRGSPNASAQSNAAVSSAPQCGLLQNRGVMTAINIRDDRSFAINSSIRSWLPHSDTESSSLKTVNPRIRNAVTN